MENDNEKIIKCICCDSCETKLFTNKNNHDILKCKVCDLLFVQPTPPVKDIYLEDYFRGANNGFGYANYDMDKQATKHTFALFLDNIEKLLPARGKLLDIGAATGYFMNIAAERGWQASGLEMSDWAASKGRSRGLDIATGTLESNNFQDDSFDAITMWDVIEHMPDPKSALERSFKLLKQGGVVAINTPDSGSLVARLAGRMWHLLVPPEHLYYFNQKNLPALSEKIGYKVLKTGRPSKEFTVNYVLRFVANRLKSKTIANIANYTSNKRIGRVNLPINLRDNMFLIFKKI